MPTNSYELVGKMFLIFKLPCVHMYGDVPLLIPAVGSSSVKNGTPVITHHPYYDN